MTTDDRGAHNDDLPRGMGSPLEWETGDNDPRADRSEYKKVTLWSSILLAIFEVYFVLGLGFIVGWDEVMVFAWFFLALWIPIGGYEVYWFNFRRGVAIEVSTVVKPCPEETCDRLEEALARRGMDHERVDRKPWLHGDHAHFRVGTALGEEALLVVSPFYYMGRSKIILRSPVERSGWWDLRSVIGDAFADEVAGTPKDLLERAYEDLEVPKAQEIRTSK